MSDSGDVPVRFRKPPAVETLQGVFFRPLPNFSSAHQGLLWAKHFRQEFPRVEERSCLEELIERFGDQIGSFPGVGIRVSDKPESPRLWARSDDRNRVLQIQRNAIVMNWLRQDEQGHYVDYPERREAFADKLRNLKEYLTDEQLGEIVPTTCLMTYVNHVDIKSLEAEPLRTADVFTFLGREVGNGWLPPPDQLVANLSFPMSNERGRLHLQINPAVKASSDGRRYVMRFELTARGKPDANTIESALNWLDLGHEWIVRGFVDITRPSWHLTWERET